MSMDQVSMNMENMENKDVVEDATNDEQKYEYLISTDKVRGYILPKTLLMRYGISIASGKEFSEISEEDKEKPNFFKNLDKDEIENTYNFNKIYNIIASLKKMKAEDIRIAFITNNHNILRIRANIDGETVTYYIAPKME